MSISGEPPPAIEWPAETSKSPETIQRARSAIASLSQILGSLPDHLSSSEDPAHDLLNDLAIANAISERLRQRNSGSGDDNLCRWFYDTFQSTNRWLQLVVLRFIPTISGLYLSRCAIRGQHRPLAGFEAVLLAIYAHETMSRGAKPVTIDLPNLSAPSPYHEAKASSLKSSKSAEEPNSDTVEISPLLEPHGTVRSTKRGRIIGVALELYYSKIASMPLESKLEFCHFASAWAGRYSSSEKAEENENEEKNEEHKQEAKIEEEAGRIPFPWELFMPALRIVGHCLLGWTNNEELSAAAMAAAKALYNRAMHDMNPLSVLAARSLVRQGLMGPDTIAEPSLASIYTTAEASPPQTESSSPVAAS